MSIAPTVETRNFAHSGDTPVAMQSLISSDDENTPHLMFCAGFHSAMAGNKATAINELCKEKQWNYTRFDYRGHGLSGGVVTELILHDWLADTLAVFDHSSKPTLLVGSSMGAWLATLVALRRPEQVTGLLLLAAAPDFLQELVIPNLSPAQIWDLQQNQAVSLANRHDNPHPITQALLDSGKQLSILSEAPTEKLTCPVRLMHGTDDQDVPYSLSIRLMENLAGADATLTLLNQADHRLSDESSIAQIREALCSLVSHCQRN